jgi:integrase/recombinase XerC
VSDSRSRLLSVVQSAADSSGAVSPDADLVLEPGLAEVVTLQRRRAAQLSDGDEQSFFLDTLGAAASPTG